MVTKTKELLSLYKQGNSKVYSELVAIIDESAFPVFFDALNDTSEHVRKLVVYKMGTFKKKETITQVAIMLKNDTDRLIRAEAALCLGKMGYEECGKYLLDALNDKESYVVQMAIRGLGLLKYQQAIELLKTKLQGDNEKNWYVQLEAARALKEITGQDWSKGIHKISPDVRVRDEQFTLKAYEEAMKRLKESIPEIIHKAKTIKEITNNPMYYIGYPNSLIQIQGYFLKQDVLLRKLQLDRVVQAKKRGESTEDDIKKAKLDYDEACKKYNYFLDNTGWVD